MGQTHLTPNRLNIINMSFPKIVRILACVADGLLLAFAISVFIVQGPHLSYSMAWVLALCVFLGGILPLLAVYIDYLQAKLAVKEQETAAPETLRDLVARFEKLSRRIEETAADAARTTLSARQLPAIIHSHLEALNTAQANLEESLKSIEKLPTSESLESLAEQLAPRQENSVDLSPLCERLEKLERDLEASLLIREDKLEAIIEQLQQLEERIEIPLAALDEATLPETEAEAASPTIPAPAPEVKTPVVESVPPPQADKKERFAKAKPAPAPDPQGDLFIQQSTAAAPARLLVKALVGLPNEIYARGDDPLSWEAGNPLQLVGIGEWLLELPDLSGPIEVQLRLNDEIAAQGPSVQLEPGQKLSVSPKFPAENEPF